MTENLIGRLLYETKDIDQLKVFNEIIKDWILKNKLDFSLLVDGLSAEREQGNTIDVAYRYISTKEDYIQHSGHEQYKIWLLERLLLH